LQENPKNPRIAAISLGLVAALAACERAPESVETPVEAVAETGCGESGFLATELYGGIERSLNWSTAEMRCESMLRPEGEGVRLRFTGDAADRRLAIILALPSLRRGVTGAELATVATLTVEGSGRFFSTPHLESCWSDISAHDAIDDSAQRYDIAGTLYCVAPLGELNGDAAISIPKLEFRGIVEWGTE